jgi:hypothetical protein
MKVHKVWSLQFQTVDVFEEFYFNFLSPITYPYGRFGIAPKLQLWTSEMRYKASSDLPLNIGLFNSFLGILNENSLSIENGVQY